MKDENGEPVEIPEDANVVWTYFRDEAGNVIEDEYRITDRDAVMDMRPEYFYINGNWSYEMEMIVGSGKQLDMGNIRYNVMVVLDFEEVDASLPLGGYTKEELSDMPMETILSLLRDADGKPIEIPEDAKLVWRDNNDGEYHLKESNDSVDVWISLSDYDYYLIVEDGKRQEIGTLYKIRAYYENLEVVLWGANAAPVDVRSVSGGICVGEAWGTCRIRIFR